MLANTDIRALTEAILTTAPQMSAELCGGYAERLISETDERLEINVRQWMDGEPLTDVWIGGYCIGMVMQIRGNKDFLGALDAMNAYAKDPAVGELKIWRTMR